MKKILLLVLCSTFTFITYANELPKDPLGSVQWNDMYNAFLKGHPAVFDERIKLIAPDFAEDPMNVPVAIDASALDNVEQMVVFADFNPIPLLAKYYPTNAKASLSLRFKIQQASPVRVAVLRKGVWHVAGLWVNSGGGGCTVASVGRLVGDWADYLGNTYGKRWSYKETNRIRFLIHHPIDTGLLPGIPAFYIEDIDFSDSQGKELARIELYEPINENPVLSFDFNQADGSSTIYMTGSDNNGNEFEASFVQ
jgi:sulfur-oxidizing protein SoxY